MSRLLMIFLILLLGSGVQAQTGYSFQLRGKDFQPDTRPVNGEPGRLAQGDLIEVGHSWLVLGPPGDYRFVFKDAGLYQKVGDGPEELVGVTVDDQESAFEKLSADQVGKLRSIELELWSPAIASKLKGIDSEFCCLQINDFFDHKAAPVAKGLPDLPSSLGYLVISERSNRGYTDLSGLKSLKDLVYLEVDLITLPEFDAANLEGLEQLRSLRAKNLTGIAGLQLPRLRYLQANLVEKVPNVDWVAGMPELELLDLKGSGALADLSGLEGHPGLLEVDAGQSPVRELPQAEVPRLRLLSVLGAEVEASVVNGFQKANPQATLRHDWASELRQALAASDRVRVRSGGTCHRNPTQEETLFEVSGAEVSALLEGIAIDNGSSGVECMCCGSPTIEFYSGPKLLAMVGFHHGQLLRWSDGWPGDAMLSDQGADFLVGWMARHGQPGPQAELEGVREQQRDGELAWKTATAHLDERMKKVLLDAIRADSDPMYRAPVTMAAALEEAYATPGERVDVLLRLLGGEGERDGWYSFEMFAIDELEKLPAELVSGRTELGVRSSDAQLKRGAERFKAIADRREEGVSEDE